jgi:hypothetical protein
MNPISLHDIVGVTKSGIDFDGILTIGRGGEVGGIQGRRVRYNVYDDTIGGDEYDIKGNESIFHSERIPGWFSKHKEHSMIGCKG